MNRKIFLPAFLILISTIQSQFLNAQYLPLVQESKHWIYYDFQKMPRPTTGFLITIQGDTIVQNTTYKKVYKYELAGEVKTVLINEPPVFVADIPYHLIEKELVSLIREDVNEKLIYNLPIKLDSCTEPISNNRNPCNDITFCDTLEHLLFDFSLSAGETLNHCSWQPLGYPPNYIPAKVDSIKMEMHFGKLRRTFYTWGIANYMPNLINPGPIPPSIVKIIQGVGFHNQGIFNYRSGNLVYYCEGSLENCNIISATDEYKLNEPVVNVFPNPTSDYIHVESDETIAGISLMNASGIDVIGFTNEKEVNMNHLPSGLYICRIQMENGYILNRKVIKSNW